MTWTGDLPPPVMPNGAARAALAVLRGGLMVLVLGGGLTALLALRLIEQPLFGLRRPVTPCITQGVCRVLLAILGLRLVRHGRPMQGRGALVANHGSWLDILVLNAADRVYFVSKAEVAGWPGIGWLARATGTVFIRRDRADAARQKLLFEARLRAGHRLLFFPEGTSSDTARVLPFKSTLFAAFFAPPLRPLLRIQPVSVVYHAPVGADARFYGWWGDMGLARHLLAVLGQPRQGWVDLVFHPPRAVADHADRKSLATVSEADVRTGWQQYCRAVPLSATPPSGRAER